MNEDRVKKLAVIYSSIYDDTASVSVLHTYASYNDNVPLEVLSATMMAKSPLYNNYANMNSSDLVKSMFQNVFGFTNEEMNTLIQEQKDIALNGSVDGIQYWIDELDNNPFITKENLAIALLNGGGEDGLNRASSVQDVAYSINNYANSKGLDLNVVVDGLYYGTSVGSAGLTHIAINVYYDHAETVWYNSYWEESGELEAEINGDTTIFDVGFVSYNGTFEDDTLSGNWHDLEGFSGNFEVELVGTNTQTAESYLIDLLS